MRINIEENKALSCTDVGSFSEDLEDNKGSEEEYSELLNFYIHSDNKVIIQNRSRSISHSSCSEDHNDYKNSFSNECQKDLDIETNCQRIEQTTKSTMTIRNKLKQNDESSIATSESEVITTVENAIVPYDINVPNNDRQQQSSSIVPYFTIFIIMMNCKDLLKNNATTLFTYN